MKTPVMVGRLPAIAAVRRGCHITGGVLVSASRCALASSRFGSTAD
jgi:hypothetical protein